MIPFGRIVVCGVGQAGAPGPSFLGFRTSFEVSYPEGDATIRVWNAPKEVAEVALVAGPLPSVILMAGHAEASTGVGIPGQVFAGDVASYAFKRDGLDTVLEIRGKQAKYVWQQARFAYTSPAATTYDALIPLAIAQAGAIPGPIIPGLPVALPFGASIDEHLASFLDRACRATGRVWDVLEVLGGVPTIAVRPSSTPTPGIPVPVFSYLAANLSEYEATDTGCKIRGLLNPICRVGGAFSVIPPLPDAPGIYTASRVKYYGDSGYADEYYVEIEGTVPV